MFCSPKIGKNGFYTEGGNFLSHPVFLYFFIKKHSLKIINNKK